MQRLAIPAGTHTRKACKTKDKKGSDSQTTSKKKFNVNKGNSKSAPVEKKHFEMLKALLIEQEASKLIMY